jgi:anionic cell wall polymer biosynthesis LytR-Cps2A-Psr (LCP) family protein
LEYRDNYGPRRPSDDDGYKMPIKKRVSVKSAEATGYKIPPGVNAGKIRVSPPGGPIRKSSGPVTAQPKKPANRNRRAIKALLAVFCLLIASVLAIGVYFVVRWKSDDYSSLQAASLVALAPVQPVVSANAAQAVPSGATPTASDASKIVYNGTTYVKNENIVNLLFLGIDSNAERKKDALGYRSDMVMVCAVDIAQKKATLISIPRDTKTTMYKVDADGHVTDTVQNKINASFSFGGRDFDTRAANTMACVQMFLERRCELEKPLDFQLDIPVYLYAGIDMDGITEVASSVGGVEVILTEDIPKVGDKGDTVTLKKQNAVEFLTNRHDTNGDTHRAARQQQFMLALAKKIKGMGPVNIIISLYDDLQKYVHTNLTTDQMIDFAKVLTKVNIDSIDIKMVPGKGSTSGTYYMIHDEDATLQMLLDVYYNKVS